MSGTGQPNGPTAEAGSSSTELIAGHGRGLRVAAVARDAVSNSLIRNSSYILATTVVTSALGYLYWIITARLYPVQTIGVAAAGLSAASLASLLATLGVHFGLIHLLPRRRDPREWAEMVNGAMVATTLAGAAAGLIAVVAVFPYMGSMRSAADDAWFIVLFVAQAALGTTASILDYISVAERAAHGMLVRNIASSVLRIALVAAPWLVSTGTDGLLASWAISNAVVVIGSLAVLRRRRPGYSFTLRHLRRVCRELVVALWHHAINLGNLAPVLILPVVAAARLSPADAAYVYTAWKVGGLFFMVSPAVSSALFAEGSHVSEGINRKVRTSALVTASLLVPLMAGFALFGRPVLALFGPDYASHGIALLLVLVVSAVPDAVTNVYISVLRIQDRLRLAAVLNCGAAVLAIALAWWLLPILGLLGAGVAWLAAQAAGSLVVLADVLYQRRRRAGRALARCD